MRAAGREEWSRSDSDHYLSTRERLREEAAGHYVDEEFMWPLDEPMHGRAAA
jgi:hypothetical protein